MAMEYWMDLGAGLHCVSDSGALYRAFEDGPHVFRDLRRAQDEAETYHTPLIWLVSETKPRLLRRGVPIQWQAFTAPDDYCPALVVTRVEVT